MDVPSAVPQLLLEIRKGYCLANELWLIVELIKDIKLPYQI